MGAVRNAFNGYLRDVLFLPVQVRGQQVLVLRFPSDQRRHADLAGGPGEAVPQRAQGAVIIQGYGQGSWSRPRGAVRLR
jgi:hypothetical protein